MDCFQAMRETHELREEVKKLQRVCGLKNNEIEQEVNLRIAVSIHRTTLWTIKIIHSKHVSEMQEKTNYIKRRIEFTCTAEFTVTSP